MTIHDSSPERRNLMVTSLGFIIFFLGGGALNGEEIRLQIVNITLNKPCVLAWLAWIMLFWFAWRYWLVFRDSYKQKQMGEIQKQSNNFISRKYVTLKTGMKYLKKDGFKLMIISPQNNNILSVTTIVDAEYDKKGKIITVKNHGHVEVPLTPFLGRMVKMYIYILVAIKEQGVASVYMPYLLFYFSLILGVIRLIQNYI